MKLYQGRRSSASWRVRWGLALKGLAHEPIYVDLAGGHHAVLDPVNPMHQVPTLVLDDGTILTESVAILEYLDEVYPAPPLLPAEPRARAHVRELVQLVNAGIHPLQNTIVRHAISDDDEGQRAWAARWIERGLAAYEAHVARDRHPFSCGEVITMADLYLVPQVRNARRYAVDVEQFPRIRAIHDACLATPACAASSPESVGDAPI
jgi:maleylacetoacetate isomerase